MFRVPDFSVKMGEKQVWRHVEEGVWANKYSRLRTGHEHWGVHSRRCLKEPL
jgi:hypothetical protein